MGARDLLEDLMAPFIGGSEAPEPAKFAEFAGVRRPQDAAQVPVAEGDSQNSQDSQGVSANSTSALPPPSGDIGPPAWTARDIARFLARRDRLMRWGWTESEADAVAARLTRRDLDASDDRRACIECRHYERGHCARHRAALLASNVIGRDLAVLPQRCPAHEPAFNP